MFRTGILSCFLAAALFAQPAGKAEFERHCGLCHGLEGKGGRGPALNHPKLSKAADGEALKKLIENGIEPEMPSFWFLTPADVIAVASYVRELGRLPAESVSGDAAHGAIVYQTAGCSSCHFVAGQGSGFGPDLSEIGSRRNAAHLRSAILKPDSVLPDKFLVVEAVSVDGKKVRGIRVNEDTFTVQIKDAGGRFHSFKKSDLASFRKLRGETPMPSFEGKLSPEETQDLVAWLASLKAKQ